MNEFDFDVMQKKRIAASARKRVCGSKSKWVGLPSDHLTPAQMKARSGPVMSYNLSYPMDYETFKSMPLDLQQSYLDGLHSRFCVGSTTVGKDLFGLSQSAIYIHAKAHGLKSRQGKKLSAAERAVWERWIESGCKAEEPEVLEVPCEKCEEVPETPPEKCEEVQEKTFEVQDLTATFVGEFDPEKFLKWVAALPIPDCKVKIRLEVTSDVQ